MAIDTHGESVSRPDADAGADKTRRLRLDRILAGLETQLEVAGIQIGDPRFRWLGTLMTPPPALSTSLLDTLRRLVTDDSLELDGRVERLEHVRDYVVELEAQDLEDELAGILGPVVGRPGTQAARLPAMMRRLGWDGGPPATLEEVGDQLGVTRERVRQIELTVDAAIRAHGCWTPVLDRAIRILARESPVPFDRVGTMLTRARLTTNAGFSAESVLSAQRLLNDVPRLAESTVHDVRFIVRVGDALDVPWLSAARSTIQRRVSNQGVAEIAAVIADAAKEGILLTAREIEQAAHWHSRWDVLDGRWIVPTDLDTRNPLLTRIRKVLSIAPGIALPTLFAQLSRYSRPDREFDVPKEGMRAFVHWHPTLTLDMQDHVWSTIPIAPDEVLSDSELVILATLGTAESVAYATVVDAMEAAGLTKISASVVLRDSPIVIKVARNAYCLVRSSTTPDVAAADEDDGPESRDDDAVVDPSVSEAAITAVNTGDLPHIPEPAASDDLESANERNPQRDDNSLDPENAVSLEETIDDGLVRRIVGIAMGRIAERGCTTRAYVARETMRDDPQATPEVVKEVLDHTDGMLWLDGDWITCLDQACHNPLRDRIDNLARKDRRITPNTIRPQGREGASIPDRVYKRLIDRYATWQTRPIPQPHEEREPAPDDGSDDPVAASGPDPAELDSPDQAAPGAMLPVNPRDDDAQMDTIRPLRLFDPVETQPALAFDQSSLRASDPSPDHQPVPRLAPATFTDARDDRSLIDALTAPDFAAYYDAAATKLGHDADTVYAAFDLIPPDIVRWLRGNAERSRRVRALMAEADGDGHDPAGA